MEFMIDVLHDRRRYRFKVKQVYSDERIDRYEVSGKNRSIQVQTNRKFFKGHPGLKHRKPQWFLYNSSLHNQRFFEEICNGIEEYLEGKRGS